MKRRLFKLAWFILLGAIVNVAVAWGCATVLKPRHISHVTTSRAECIAQIANHFDIPPNGAVIQGFIQRTASFKRQYTSRQASDTWDYIIVVHIESGWPVRCTVNLRLNLTLEKLSGTNLSD